MNAERLMADEKPVFQSATDPGVGAAIPSSINYRDVVACMGARSSVELNKATAKRGLHGGFPA
jgi:hypothetical protein